ncbi:fz domain protein [Ostertagia ostertagi]
MRMKSGSTVSWYISTKWIIWCDLKGKVYSAVQGRHGWSTVEVACSVWGGAKYDLDDTNAKKMSFERYYSLFLLPFLIIASYYAEAQVYQQQMLPSSRKCVPLRIPMCIDLPYNSTVYPNLLNHQTQEDAEIAINQFSPLVKVRCSEDIKLFLCTVWVVLCLAWFLAANRKWGAESIAGLAPYLHAACWGIPALLSVVVLVTNSIDGDIFTALYTLRCLHPDRVKFGFSMPRTSCSQRMDAISPGPELVLIFIKYLCQLIVGITCAVWICSAKTVASYQKAYARIILRRAAVATDEH